MSIQSRESKKSKPKQYEEHERKVLAAIEYKREHPEVSWEYLHREFGPAANTIKNRYLGRTTACRLAHSSQQRLPRPLEDAVIERIKELDAEGRPPNAKRVRALAYTVLRDRHGDGEPPLGKQWAYRLMKRRSGEIARRVRRQLERERLAAQSKEEVERHFKRLSEVIRRHRILPDDIWNSDQKGFQIGAGKNFREVVYVDSRRVRANKLASGKGTCITLHETISATGRSLPAYYILTGEGSITGTAIPDEAEDDASIAVSDKGRTNDELCLAWLRDHFDRFAVPSAPGRKRLLILDDLENYHTLEFESYCQSHGIQTYILPGHTTHLLQPCDLGVFSTLGLRVHQAAEDWWDLHPFATRMQVGEFIGLCDKVRQQAFTPSNIRASFRRAGIHPLNKLRVLQDPNIQWQTPNPYRRRTSITLRALPHRQKPPASEAERLSSLPPTPENYHTAVAYAQKLEAKVAMLRAELLQQQRAKSLRAADRRIMSRKRTGTSIRELRQARLDRMKKEAEKAERKVRKEGARSSTSNEPRRTQKSRLRNVSSPRSSISAGPPDSAPSHLQSTISPQLSTPTRRPLVSIGANCLSPMVRLKAANPQARRS